ncbi:MAG: dihydropteroate synthase [Candidatus Omnitrophica bacterium]|nr:dihydropteroate synthase [Candidatus Omnitrophota bacterium]
MQKKILKLGQYRLDLSKKTLIMGVLNVTPDSFSDGGRYPSTRAACERALEMESEGADIIDIGGESTRPGSLAVPAEEEIKRVLPVLKGLKGKLRIPVSVDTKKSKVAEAVLKEGAAIINDVSGLRADKNIASLCAKYSAGLVIMHMKGNPRTMQKRPYYKDLLKEIKLFLKKSIDIAVTGGVQKNKIIIDPGIGFGKTLQHNLSLLKGIQFFRSIGFPVLIGLSRKSFMGKLLGLDLQDRLIPTACANAISVYNGADIIRAHDIKEAVITAKIAEAVAGYKTKR